MRPNERKVLGPAATSASTRLDRGTQSSGIASSRKAVADHVPRCVEAIACSSAVVASSVSISAS